MDSMSFLEHRAEYLVRSTNISSHSFARMEINYVMSLQFVDMIKRKSLRTRAIKMLVLDEADEMLNKGFKEQIYDVYRYLPPSTQVNH